MVAILVGLLLALRMILTHLRASHASAGHVGQLNEQLSALDGRLGRRIDVIAASLKDHDERLTHLNNRTAR